ncbi:MAG: glucokinase [Acidobacteria bacterium]|nr:glucokinase [Acidobacteriota bacterium]
MLLAADVGGTKTLVGLFRPGGVRPVALATRVYATQDYSTLSEIVHAFLADVDRPAVQAIAAGVAGPVEGLRATLTNVDWTADLDEISRALGGCPAALLNDLESMAYSVSVLEADELCVLQAGRPAAAGNCALIAAGTGLNASHIPRVNGRLVPSASESGHADFAARTRRELELVEHLTREYGRAEVEAVLSGPGIVNLFQFTHASDRAKSACPVVAADLGARAQGEERDRAADVTAAALERTCHWCEEALGMFVSAYGAETGNVALRALAIGGIYIGGGIAPKILPALEAGSFMEAFLAKGPMTPLLQDVPVKVVLNAGAGLIGASVKAAALLER